ncbi:CPBP family intramembrane glutamic endopeptidase, partial [Methylocucumis oryzae]
GVLGTLPLLVMFFSLHQVSAPAIQQIRHLLLATLGPMLSPYSWPHLLLLGAIAGFAEELLFRGVLEPWLASNFGYIAGLLLSNLLFGLVHAVTPLYALLAGLVGLYFSVSMTFGGGYNLLTPMLIHGLYDFLAFIALVRMYRALEKPL